MVLNDKFCAIISNLRMIEFIIQCPIHVRNFRHFEELFLNKSCVFPLLTHLIQILEICIIYSSNLGYFSHLLTNKMLENSNSNYGKLSFKVCKDY